MITLSQEEFNQQSSSGTNSLEKIYQGKTIEGGPVFSLGNLKAAESYCKRFARKKAGAICIIVQEKSFLRIWNEAVETGQNTTSNLTPLISDEREVETSSNSVSVEAEFVNFCQKLLAEYIGPIASVVCKKTLGKKPNLSRTEFVEILAEKISDPNQAQEFKQAVLD